MTPFDAYTFAKAQERIPADRDSPYLDMTVEGAPISSGYAAEEVFI